MCPRVTKLAVVAILCLVWTSRSPAAEPSGLASFKQAQSARDRWMLQFETVGTTDSALAHAADQVHNFRLQCTCFRDGDRVDVLTVREDDGKPIRAWRSIINRWYLAYEVPPVGKRAIWALFAADGSQFVGAAMPSGLVAFEGYVAGDYLNLTQIIQAAANLQISNAAVDGRDCLLVKADSPDYGRYQLWLDPHRDYYPRKIVVEKDARSYWGGSRLSQWTSLAPPGSRGTVMVRRMTFTLDQAHFDQVDGRWCPLSCRLTRVQHFVDGNSQMVVMQSRRTRLDLDPDFRAAGAFMPELGEGSSLANQIDPHLPYQWTNDTPQPMVDKSVVNQMDRTAAILKRESDH